MMSFARSVVAALFCLIPFVGKADVWANFVDVCPAGSYVDVHAGTQASLKFETIEEPLKLGKWIDDSMAYDAPHGLDHQAWDFILDEPTASSYVGLLTALMAGVPGLSGTSHKAAMTEVAIGTAIC
ncbi:MAG: hypothetical protein DHS20C11_34020 [Lysobacteraceae bacterium]|nr:MAG: hypothetical protein DHS20C11_34020 [Xanthomonadaceae bacterium]